MQEVDFNLGIIEIYNSFKSAMPASIQSSLDLLVLVVIIVLYSIFIWKFYRFIAQKNFLGLNLNKYNTSENAFFMKIFAGILYFLEYLIILPFLIFFWFVVFTLFLIFLTENLEISQILIVSATIIAAIRMTCYYKEDLAKDLAKMLPFTLLAISLTNPKFFDFSRITTKFADLPFFFTHILYYLLFIIGLEIILRFFDFIFSLFGLEEENEVNE